jgi:hypothetical protein
VGAETTPEAQDTLCAQQEPWRSPSVDNNSISNSSGNSCPTGTGDQGRERSMARHYCYTDAVTQTVVLATRSGACQATTRMRYFLKGDKSAIVAEGDGFRFRPHSRTAKDVGMVSECVPCVWGHTANPPMGLSPQSFQSLCRCAVCGAVQLLHPRSHRRGAAGDVQAAAQRQGDDAPPHRLRCVMCDAFPKGHPLR